MITGLISKIAEEVADVIPGTDGIAGRVGRFAGVVADAVALDIRIDQRLNRERARFSRQESPLDFISATFASVFGLPEDTITENIARIRGTSPEGAHVFLFEWARRVTRDRTVARRLLDLGTGTELRNARKKSLEDLDAALEEIQDPRRRARLRRRFK